MKTLLRRTSSRTTRSALTAMTVALVVLAGSGCAYLKDCVVYEPSGAKVRPGRELVELRQTQELRITRVDGNAVKWALPPGGFSRALILFVEPGAHRLEVNGKPVDFFARAGEKYRVGAVEQYLRDPRSQGWEVSVTSTGKSVWIRRPESSDALDGSKQNTEMVPYDPMGIYMGWQPVFERVYGNEGTGWQE